LPFPLLFRFPPKLRETSGPDFPLPNSARKSVGALRFALSPMGARRPIRDSGSPVGSFRSPRDLLGAMTNEEIYQTKIRKSAMEKVIL